MAVIDWKRYLSDPEYRKVAFKLIINENESRNPGGSEITVYQTLLDKQDVEDSRLREADKKINKGYGPKALGKVALAEGAMAASAGLGAFVWPYISPYVTGALNLTGGVAGANDIIANNRFGLMVDNFSQGKYYSALKDAGTGVLDALGIFGPMFSTTKYLFNNTNVGKNYQLVREMNRSLNQPLLISEYEIPFMRASYSVSNPSKYYYWEGTPKPDWSNFNKRAMGEDMRKGKQELIDWVESPEYKLAALLNLQEAESMGFPYYLTWEKPSYNAFKNEGRIFLLPNPLVKGANGWHFMNPVKSDPDVHISAQTTANAKNVVRHEGAHASELGDIDRSRPDQILLMKYLRFKNSLVFDDTKSNLEEYADFYNFGSDGWPHEAAALSRDLGDSLGITVGLSYPGDLVVLDLFKKLKSENPEGTFKGDFVRAFKLNKEDLQYVWKALNGTLWMLIPFGFGLASVYGKQN